ncbi:MAG: hypothetical protein JNM33_14685 [Rubrivivax sp.]|nr:hypothetical protein [Rubrivivax sp.]
MKLQAWMPLAALCVSTAILAPAAQAQSRAALVELAQPSRPFNDSANGSASYVTVGPGAVGKLGVTAITLSNLGTTARTIFVFAPVMQNGFSCGSTNVIGGSQPRFYVVVPASQTVHLTYPTPMVFPGVGGQSCVAFGSAANVDITVNGFVN